ncbi:MAG TPA: hypothetical protein IAC20_02420 [Candidatus Faecisoma merdavium]|nr:hypothetical protein [Candidatus Faecisoma merdavium]
MKIAYLYYDFLNLYGESGNIKIISNILKYNKIKHEILYLSLDDELEFDKYDLVYIGSGTEDNLLIALKHLSKYKNDIKKYIEDNKFMLVTGNSVDMFGKKIDDNKALNIFEYEVTKGKRKMEEVYHNKILGFINNNSYNNNYCDTDIIRHNNFYGTYILGPILVRNPYLVKQFLNDLTNKKLKYDLKLETKAYNEFIKNFKENTNE